jgi:hypothetical protein
MHFERWVLVAKNPRPMARVGSPVKSHLLRESVGFLMKTTKVGPLFVHFIAAFLLIRLVESMFHASSLKALFTQVLSLANC